MINLQINTGGGYGVTVSGNALSLLPEKVILTAGSGKVCIVSDRNVAAVYADRVRRSLSEAGIKSELFVFEPGEASKCKDTLFSLLEYLAEKELTRTDLLIALGGGVTGDITGLAAALYMRGIKYIQVPTTLLAMTDSSVGGKTAVNLNGGKNLAGCFYDPVCVLCDTSVLKTLPADVFAQGMAEVIKYSVICDPELFRKLKAQEKPDIDETVGRCISIKKRFVEDDRFDFGNRRLLNLGHTVGHACEALSGFNMPHGFAVAVGMAYMAAFSEKNGFAAEELSAPLREVLKANGLPADCPFTAAELLPAMLPDKKRSEEKINLVIPVKIGKCIIKSFAPAELEELFF